MDDADKIITNDLTLYRAEIIVPNLILPTLLTLDVSL